ncbi:cytochrome c [Cobetia sp. MC34]|uniref:cytochrome c n=1 Tax=Cobetia sp. MC34 TaxID=2785080 RepID=UPI002016442A|nr:cytochrome c [Cobetia sp. MC34]
MPQYRNWPVRLALLAAAVSAAGAAMAVLGDSPTHSQSSISTDSAANPQLIKRGAYLARAADCMACHTREGASKEYAGGRPIESPFGTIYATNITPAPKAGIGEYREQDFAAALRQGIRADGSYLYPAMPYPSYASLSDDDIKALYAYFMEGVPPVTEPAPETSLSFPFNQRWAIRFWNWLFVDEVSNTSSANHSRDLSGDRQQLLERGRYLVQGAGHCGSCHTPRGLFMQEKALNDQDGDEYLAGTELNEWQVPSLRGGDASGLRDWSEDDVIDYLATGRNRHAATGGEMTSVIQHSTSHLTDADLSSIAAYLTTLGATDKQRASSAPASTPSSHTAPDATTRQLTSATSLDEGARLYLDNCNACHFANGRGADSVFPPLSGNTQVNADNPTALISTILYGAQLPSTPKRPERLQMPGFDWRLSNEEAASLASFVRQSWSNDASRVTPEQVAEVRQAHGPVNHAQQGRPNSLGHAPEGATSTPLSN